MTLIKTILAVAIVSAVVTAAASTHKLATSGNQISQTDQWEIPIAAPFGATGFVDLDIIF